jgi:hypothetical protein
MLDDEAESEPSDFILLIEEKRLVADISGAPTLQTQWRKASRRDATRVVRMYNEKNPAEGPGEKLAERVSGADYSLQQLAGGNIMDAAVTKTSSEPCC